MGSLLRTDVPGSIQPISVLSGEVFYRAAENLLHTVRTGETAFPLTFGVGFFDYLSRHPSVSETSNAAMLDRLAQHVAVSRGYDFSAFRSLVEVGGGRGG